MSYPLVETIFTLDTMIHEIAFKSSYRMLNQLFVILLACAALWKHVFDFVLKCSEEHVYIVFIKNN